MDLIIALRGNKWISLQKINFNIIDLINIKPSKIKGYFEMERYNSHELVETYTKRPINIDYLYTCFKAWNIDLTGYEIKTCDYEEPNKELSNSINNNTNVYVIQSNMGGLIKIGKADVPELRLEQIQNMSPVRLEFIHLFKNVNPNFEFYLHKKYDDFREYGEWFSSSILEDVINEKQFD